MLLMLIWSTDSFISFKKEMICQNFKYLTKLIYLQLLCYKYITICRNSDQISVLFDKGIIYSFLDLLNSTNIEVITVGLLCLADIAAKNTHVRDMVIEAGAVITIANILDKAESGSILQKSSCLTLADLFKGILSP